MKMLGIDNVATTAVKSAKILSSTHPLLQIIYNSRIVLAFHTWTNNSLIDYLRHLLVLRQTGTVRQTVCEISTRPVL